jgi:hypothetical protein
MGLIWTRGTVEQIKYLAFSWKYVSLLLYFWNLFKGAPISPVVIISDETLALWRRRQQNVTKRRSLSLRLHSLQLRRQFYQVFYSPLRVILVCGRCEDDVISILSRNAGRLLPLLQMTQLQTTTEDGRLPTSSPLSKWYTARRELSADVISVRTTYYWSITRSRWYSMFHNTRPYTWPHILNTVKVKVGKITGLVHVLCTRTPEPRLAKLSLSMN